MAKQENNPNALKNQRELNQAGSEYLGIQKEILSTMKQMAGFQNASAAEQRKIEQTMSAGTKLAKMLEGYTKEDLKSARKRQAFQSKFNEFKSKEAGIQEDINELMKDSTKESKKLAKTLSDAASNGQQLADEAEKLSKKIKDLEKVTGFFEGFENLVKDIPVVRSIFSEFTKGSQAAADSFAEFSDGGKAFAAGMGQVIKGLTKLASGGLITALVNGLVQSDKTAVSLSNSLGLGSKAAEAFKDQLQSIDDSQFTLPQLTESAMALTDALEAAVPPSAETVRQVAMLSERLGISAQQSAEIFKTSALTGKSFEEVTNNIIGQTKAMNVNSDVTINYRDILKDVAASSEANRLTINKFPGGIQKAAYQARRLGLSFATLESAGSGLLDFEQSISAELEAELLTGKQLNLQKAREAALMGDQATLAEEIANQIGSAEEFGRMNVIQQEALAKSVGLSREELAKSLNQRKALLALEKESGIAGIARMDTEEQIAALMDQGKTRADALKALGDNEGAARAASLTASEALKNAMTELGDELSKLIEGLTGESNPLGIISKYIQKIADFIGSETSEGSGKKNIAGIAGGVLGGAAGMRAGAGAQLLGAGKLASKSGSLGKLAKAVGGKTLGRLIPGLGFGLALTDLLQGDYTGAGINAVAGIASFFPGLGTAVAAGLGAVDLARETVFDGKQLATGGIVTRPTRALVGEAGAEAVVPLNEFYAKMDELISAVKAGGDVYMDGNKVGQSLVLSTYKTT